MNTLIYNMIQLSLVLYFIGLVLSAVHTGQFHSYTQIYSEANVSS